MGLFGNKREKSEKVDKYEYHSSNKGARQGGYGPPALPGTPPSPYLSAGPGYFDGGFAPQGKMNKYGKYAGMNKSLYGMDPMNQAMFIPPQSSNALQAQAQAIFQMQQYMQGQSVGSPYGNVLSPMSMNMAGGVAVPSTGLLPVQGQPYLSYPGQAGVVTPFFDPSNMAFQQQGAFAPYQQPNFYDPNGASAFVAPYGYMPAAY